MEATDLKCAAKGMRTSPKSVDKMERSMPWDQPYAWKLLMGVPHIMQTTRSL